MATDKSRSAPHQSAMINSNVDTQKIYSVLPLFGVINITISSGTTIYRAYKNDDIIMIVFIIYVYFGSFFLDYWFQLYHKLPRSENSPTKRNLKIGIWVLLSSIMFGFACEFSTFMRLTESLCFFAVVIGGNSFLFYVYFIWDGDKGKVANNGCCKSENEDVKEYKILIEVEASVDNV